MAGALALPLPSTERLLRGVLTTLGEMDVAGRPDLTHMVAMAKLTVGHLLARQNLGDYAAIYADMLVLAREGAERFALSGEDGSGLRSRLEALPPDLAADDFDAMQAQIGHALEVLREVLDAAAGQALPAHDPFLARVQAAEVRFYTAHLGPPASSAAPEAPPLSREAFEAYLREHHFHSFAGVTSFTRLVGGFQKETILVEAELASGGTQAMVIRAEKHDRFVRFTASEIVDEYAIVQAMWDKGLPVAEPLWLEADATRLGRRFMVSRRAAGGNAGDSMHSAHAYSAGLTHSFIDTLAQLHALPLDAAVAATKLGGWLRHSTLAENTAAEVAAWRNQIWIDRAPASPAFTRLFDWLEANVPNDEGELCVVHNDYGPHNILVHEDRVSAVLDWEVPRIGDPAEDVSYFLQCAGAAVDPSAALTRYAERSGRLISPYRLKYFDVLSCGKVLVSTLSASAMYQATDPALIDWVQMPLLWHGNFAPQVEARIAAAEQARGR